MEGDVRSGKLGWAGCWIGVLFMVIALNLSVLLAFVESEFLRVDGRPELGLVKLEGLGGVGEVGDDDDKTSLGELSFRLEFFLRVRLMSFECAGAACSSTAGSSTFAKIGNGGGFSVILTKLCGKTPSLPARFRPFHHPPSSLLIISIYSSLVKAKSSSVSTS